jgi:hypothetical protein
MGLNLIVNEVVSSNRILIVESKVQDGLIFFDILIDGIVHKFETFVDGISDGYSTGVFILTDFNIEQNYFIEFLYEQERLKLNVKVEAVKVVVHESKQRTDHHYGLDIVNELIKRLKENELINGLGYQVGEFLYGKDDRMIRVELLLENNLRLKGEHGQDVLIYIHTFTKDRIELVDVIDQVKYECNNLDLNFVTVVNKRFENIRLIVEQESNENVFHNVHEMRINVLNK